VRLHPTCNISEGVQQRSVDTFSPKRSGQGGGRGGRDGLSKHEARASWLANPVKSSQSCGYFFWSSLAGEYLPGCYILLLGGSTSLIISTLAGEYSFLDGSSFWSSCLAGSTSSWSSISSYRILLCVDLARLPVTSTDQPFLCLSRHASVIESVSMQLDLMDPLVPSTPLTGRSAIGPPSTSALPGCVFSAACSHCLRCEMGLVSICGEVSSLLRASCLLRSGQVMVWCSFPLCCVRSRRSPVWC
jgi:hypothetical protein